MAAAPAQQGAQAGQQFVEIERLDQVIVGARVEPLDAGRRAVARRNDQHRQVGAALARRAQHVHALQAGQAQVEQHQVVVETVERQLRLAAVAHPVHRIAFATQAIDQALADHRIIFHQQQSHADTPLLTVRHLTANVKRSTEAGSVSDKSIDDHESCKTAL